MPLHRCWDAGGYSVRIPIGYYNFSHFFFRFVIHVVSQTPMYICSFKLKYAFTHILFYCTNFSELSDRMVA